MAYKGQYTIFCLCFGRKHYTFGFYLSSTMKESREKVVKYKKNLKIGERFQTQQNIPLKILMGIIQRMIRSVPQGSEHQHS